MLYFILCFVLGLKSDDDIIVCVHSGQCQVLC